MDGQVKEARGQQLQSLDLHPVVEEVGIWYEGVGTMILEEIDHLDDSDWAWREQDTTLKVKSRSVWNGIEEWAEYDKKFPAVLFPFQCEFEVLMSYEFYTNYVFKGTPPPNPKNGEGDALRGWFPIQRDKFDQGRGLVMSDLPFHLMISDKVRGREKEEMKEREEKTELSNSFTPLPPTDALALPLETTGTFETFSLKSRDQPPTPPNGTTILLETLSETRQGEKAVKNEKNEKLEKTQIIVPVSQRTAVISMAHSKAHFPILEDNPVVVGQKTTDDGQCNTFPIVDNDPGCEQEDGSKTACSGGTQFNTFPILEDNPVVGGQKTTDEGQFNTFPIVDNDPGCEQEGGSKTACSGGTQYNNTFPILEDNPQEDGSKTSTPRLTVSMM